MSLLLTNATILNNNNEEQLCEIFVDDGKIVSIGKKLSEKAKQVIDCKGTLVSPGFVDVHVHLREPGGEHKETIETGTKSAARGGYTTICSMPNTNPVPDNVDTLANIQKVIDETAVVRVLPYAAITTNLEGTTLSNIQALAEKSIAGFTDDGVGIQSAGLMYEAMQEAAANNRPIVAHCEDNSLLYGGAVHKGEVSERMNIPGILSLSESVHIARDVLLAEATGCHYHVCHVSTKESVRVIRDAKRAGIHVTAEVSPHHLLLNETDVTVDDANLKMNPPLRGKEDQEALLEGLLDGTLDCIATDHAPHSEEEKSVGIEQAPFGIVGLETAFPLMYTHLVKKGIITLRELIDYMAKKPAEIFNLPYGTLEIGQSADITCIDLQADHVIDKETFVSKGMNTPFNGWDCKGRIVRTIVAGEVVFEEADHA